MQEDIRILILDDQLLFREGLKQILQLESDFKIVGAGSFLEAIDLAEALRPDVIIADIPANDESRILKRLCGVAKVLVLSHCIEKEWVNKTFVSGASGYILKEINPAELIGALRTVASGDSYIYPKVAVHLIEELRALQGCRRTMSKDGPAIPLTNREKEILQLMIDVGSNRAIGKALRISEKTVKNHLSNIFKKLGSEDRTQAVVISIKQGFIHV